MRSRLRALLACLFARSRAEADMADELAFHLQSRIDDLVVQGLTPDEAARQARVEFGGIELHKDRCREAFGWRIVDELRADVRYGARSLWQHPAFAVVAILTWAVGIGANTVMFGVIDALLLRPPSGVADPASVVRIYPEFHHPTGLTRTFVSTSEYDALVREPIAGASLIAYAENTARIGTDPDSPEARIAFASERYFTVLGIKPRLGRWFSGDEETSEAAAHVVVLSNALWKARFAGRLDAIGQTLTVGGMPLRVVGIASASFTGTDLDPVALWLPLPLAQNQAFLGRYMTNPHTLGQYRWLWLLARPQPTASHARIAGQIETRISEVDARIEGPSTSTGPHANRLQGVTLTALNVRFGPLAERKAPVSVWFLGVTALVLLIACANLANLLLARAVQRRHEIGVRLALGGSRSRLVRQLFVESLILAASAGVAALVLTIFCTRLVALLPLPPLGELVDWRVLTFTATVSLLATLLFGVVPAFWATRHGEHALLQNAGPRTSGRRSRLRGGLLIAQLALSLILLVAAGLFVRSLQRVEHDAPGFPTDSVVVARLDLQSHGYSAVEAQALEEGLLTRLQQSPGIVAAALTTSLAFREWALVIVGIAPASGRLGPPMPAVITSDSVSPGFFRALDLPVLKGRTFTPTDRDGSPSVAVINATMARELWPGDDALGQCVHFGVNSDTCTTIIGVVGGDVRYDNVTEPGRLEMYRPIAQMPAAAAIGAGVVVRAAGSADPAVSVVRTALSSLDRALVRTPVRTAESWIEPTITPWRIASMLTGAFGVLAFLLAAVGLAGLMLFLVAQRTRELGVRLALGATAGDVVRLVVRDGMRLTLAGIVIGLGGAAVISRLITRRLYETSALDPLAYLGATVLLVLVALLATYLPARRAASVDPAVVLRAE